MAITVAEIHWAAGFLDGEGCFRVEGVPCTSLNVSASQKDRWPMDKLQRLFGGVVKYRYRRSRTRVDSPIWEWHLSTVAAAGLMMTLFLLLQPRRRQRISELLTAWRARPVSPAHRSACPQGHLYSGTNLLVYERRYGRSGYRHRLCRECCRQRRRERYARDRALKQQAG